MSILEKIIKYSLYLVLLLPLAFTKSTMFPWHFGKTIWFQIIIEIVLFLAIVFLIFSYQRAYCLSGVPPSGAKSKAHVQRIDFKINLLDWLILIFLVVLIVAAIFGVNPNKSFWGNQARVQGVFTWLHFALFYFLLRIFITTSSNWKRICEWVIYISAVASLFGWFAYLTGSFQEYVLETGRIASIIGNPIFFANYLIIPIFLAFWWWWDEKTGKRRWLIFALGCFNLLTLLFTSVRASFVALVVGLLIIWLGLVFILWQPFRRRAVIFLSLGIILLLLFVSFCFLNQKTEAVNKAVPVLSRLLSIDIQSATAQTRLMAWQIAWQGFLDKPLLGWGPENYQDLFDKHYNPNFLKYSFAETVWDKPHNYFLEVLSSSGILGAIAYLSLIFYLFWQLIKKALKEIEIRKKISLLIIFAAAVAYIIQLSFSFETSNSLIIWFFFLALANFLVSVNAGVNTGVVPRQPTEERPRQVVVSYILIFILTIVISGLIFQNLSFLSASRAMAKARDAADENDIIAWQKAAPEIFKIKAPFLPEQAIYIIKDLSTFDANNQLDKKTLELVKDDLIKILTEEAQYDKNSFVARMWLGQLYTFLGEYVDNKYFADSEKVFLEAGQFNQSRQHIPMLLAKSYLIQGKDEEAISLLKKLAEENPEFPEPHWFLGLALIKKGEIKNGLVELEKGSSFGLGFKNNIFYLIDLYHQEKMYDKIVPLYKLLIQREPNNAKYYANLAATYIALGDVDSTIEALNKAVELDPSLKEEALKFLEMHNIKP